MRRTIMSAVAVLALAGCGGGSPSATAPATATVTVASAASSASAAASSSPFPSEQLPPSTVERLFGEELQKQGLVPKYGTVQGSIELARAICDRFKLGDSYPTVAGILTRDGMTASEAGRFTGMATVAFCPQYTSKLTH